MNNRKYKVALLTGATKGIGKAIALQLARSQHDLCIVGRTVSDLEKTSSELENLWHKMHFR